jgi:hypothetical protein
MWRTPKKEISILSSVITDPEDLPEVAAWIPKETTAAIHELCGCGIGFKLRVAGD